MDQLTLDIYIISRCTHNYYARELKKLGVTMGQFPFIMGIAAKDGISQEKLSTEMMISKSTTTAVVAQLLEKSLVSREVDQKDRRNFKLHATAKARMLVPKISAVIECCHRQITARLSDAERRTFAELTDKVRRQTESALGKK